MNNQDPFQPLTDRGISDEVRDARGYVPYYGKHHPKYDEAAPRELPDPSPTADGPKGALPKFARESRDAPPPKNTFLRFEGESRPPRVDDGHDGYGQGLVMLKHPLPGEPPILPQLRPEFSVRTGGTTWHTHDEA